MLWAILNKSWRQSLTKQQLYGHLSPIMKTIQVRRTRHVGHYGRSGDELISNILLWTPSHGWAKARQPARTYIQQLCTNTGYSLEDLPEAMDDRDRWRERVWEIHASGATWWWWWWLLSVAVSEIKMSFVWGDGIKSLVSGMWERELFSHCLQVPLIAYLCIFVWQFDQSLSFQLHLIINSSPIHTHTHTPTKPPIHTHWHTTCSTLKKVINYIFQFFFLKVRKICLIRGLVFYSTN